MPPSGVLRVVLDRPLRTSLDYRPPAGRTLGDVPAGVRVRVPVGRAQAVGLVVEHAARSDVDPAKLRDVLEVLDDAPVLEGELLALLRWTAEYYHHPPGEVLFGALPVALRKGGTALAREQVATLSETGREAANSDGEALKRAPRQRELWRWLLANGGRGTASALDAALQGWRSPAQSLAARGWLVLGEQAIGRTAAGSDAGAAPPVAQVAPPLTDAQTAVVAAIDGSVGRFAPILLQGVTGSGKTEVYLQSVAATLARGQGALVLVPEIGLTPQLVERFRSRFGVPIALLHSALGDGERLAAWRSAWSGEARIVIGTRSAVFAPVHALGLIVVDEEHDSSYKQQEGGCRYSARDLAVRRAQLLSIPVVLGSATPALETLHNALQQRYRRFLLPRRDDQAAAPRLALIDLRTQSVHAGLSGAATQAMQRHLEAGGQVLVFINRRGYAPTLLCTSCGWIAPCQQCDARMTVHQQAGRLRCHHCGADEPLPERCPRCGFAVKSVGQGTERVEASLSEVFPDHKLVRLDRDTARSATQIEAVTGAVLSGEARILVGTQMITKGHHFPDVTLVVVLNADQGLFSTDFRAAERLAQTIVQVAGRAGRAERPGEVLIQSEYPEHPLLLQLLDKGYEGFAESALAERAAAHWPPFGRIALLRASARDAAPAVAFLRAARRLSGMENNDPSAPVRVLGPVPAAMARRAGRHHLQLLVESAERAALQTLLRRWIPRIEELPEARRVRWSLDVDPLETQ
jgi:primosomal protein N' (replication factor Y)